MQSSRDVPCVILALLLLAGCATPPARAQTSNNQLANDLKVHSDAEDKPAPKMPGAWRSIEVGLSDDAIVALVDLKIERIDHDEKENIWYLKCTGDVKRFVAGTDKNTNIEFFCTVDLGYFSISIEQEMPVGFDLRDYVDADKVADCVIVYRRREDGMPIISRLHPEGLDFVPAYEWLENTKDRKEDRVALAAIVIMDRDAKRELKAVAYRTVAFSDLAFRSKYEIITKGMDVGNRDDIGWGVGVLAKIPLDEGSNKEENTRIIRYFLKKLAPASDVRDAIAWLWGINECVNGFDISTNSDFAREIAHAVKEHQVSPAPDPNDMHTYYNLRDAILEKVEPKQAPPMPGGGNP